MMLDAGVVSEVQLRFAGRMVAFDEEATRNVGDFQGIGLELINPWEPPATTDDPDDSDAE